MPISSIGGAVNTIASAAAHVAQDDGPAAPETSHPETTDRRISNVRILGTLTAGGGVGGVGGATTSLPVKADALMPGPPPITPNPLTDYVPPGGLHAVAGGQVTESAKELETPVGAVLKALEQELTTLATPLTHELPFARHSK